MRRAASAEPLPHASPARRGLLACAALTAGLALAAGAWLTWPSDDRGTGLAAAQVARGAALFAANCAGCHGDHLQGQPDWDRPNAAGRLPAPPLDASAHAWQHPDAQLFEFISHSMVSVAPPDYQTDMPAFAGRLGAGDIRELIAFIKSSWPPGTRVAQSMLNPGGATAPAPEGDWRFPPDCRPVPKPVRDAP